MPGVPLTEREPVLDLARCFAIVVVVLWHTTFSVLHYDGVRWVMPNPLHTIPGSWALTWVLQVMPLFFVVGGAVNALSWNRASAAGVTAREWIVHRLRRFGLPVIVPVVVIAAFDLVALAAWDGYRSVVVWGWVMVVPLWFLGLYLPLTLATPLWCRIGRRCGLWVFVGAAGAMTLVEVGRTGAGVAALGFVGTPLVWWTCHQMGVAQSGGALDRWSPGRWAGVLAGALVGLAAVTTWGPYPRAMVATIGDETSNLLPTTPAVALVAAAQLGVIGLTVRAARRWMLVRRMRFVHWVNGYALTIFMWHMPAVMAVALLATALGAPPPADTDLGWWLARIPWALAVAPFLALAVAVAGPLERRTRPPVPC